MKIGTFTKGVFWNRTGFNNDTRKVVGVGSGRINFVSSNFEKSLIRMEERRVVFLNEINLQEGVRQRRVGEDGGEKRQAE